MPLGSRAGFHEASVSLGLRYCVRNEMLCVPIYTQSGANSRISNFDLSALKREPQRQQAAGGVGCLIQNLGVVLEVR